MNLFRVTAVCYHLFLVVLCGLNYGEACLASSDFRQRVSIEGMIVNAIFVAIHAVALAVIPTPATPATPVEANTPPAE